MTGMEAMIVPALLSAGEAAGGFMSSLLPASMASAITSTMPGLTNLIPLMDPASPGSPMGAFGLGSKIGGGLMNLGKQVLSGMVPNALTPPPAPSNIAFNMPEGPKVPQMMAEGQGPPLNRPSDEDVLAMLLGQGRGQGYGMFRS